MKRWMTLLIAVILLFSLTACARTGYESSFTIYINNNMSGYNTDTQLTSSDIQASRELLETYKVIILSDRTLERAIQREMDLENQGGATTTVPWLTVEQAREMVSVEIIEGSSVLRITVIGEDSYLVELLAQARADVIPGAVEEIVTGTNVKIVDNPSTSKKTRLPLFES